MGQTISIYRQTSMALQAYFKLVDEFPLGFPKAVTHITLPDRIGSGGEQVVTIRSQLPGDSEFFMAEFAFRPQGSPNNLLVEVRLSGNTVGPVHITAENGIWERTLRATVFMGTPYFFPTKRQPGDLHGVPRKDTSANGHEVYDLPFHLKLNVSRSGAR